MNRSSLYCAYGPRVRTPPCTYRVCSGERLVGDQERLPVMPTVEKERPW
jgi:hypothetical protein